MELDTKKVKTRLTWAWIISPIILILAFVFFQIDYSDSPPHGMMTGQSTTTIGYGGEAYMNPSPIESTSPTPTGSPSPWNPSPSPHTSPSPSPSPGITCYDHPFDPTYKCKSYESCCQGQCYNSDNETCCDDSAIGYPCKLGESCCLGKCYDPLDKRCCVIQVGGGDYGEVTDKDNCCEETQVITEGSNCGEGRNALCNKCKEGSCQPIESDSSIYCATDGSQCAACTGGVCHNKYQGRLCEYVKPSQSHAKCKLCNAGTCSGILTCGACQRCDDTGTGAVCIGCDETNCLECSEYSIDPVTGEMGMCIDKCKPPDNECSVCKIDQSNPKGVCVNTCDPICQVCKQPENQCHEDTSICAHTRSECGCRKGSCMSCDEEQSCVYSDMTHHYYCKDPVYA